MVVWHHQLDGHEFEQALGVGEGQGSLVCCSPWGCKELDTTESTRLEALVPSRDSRARTCSPSPRAWRPDFPGAAREAP